MPYTPKYQITNKILHLVGTVDAAREVITSAPLVPAWERNFQNQAKVRTIHHGTHLEGNNLNLDEVEDVINPSSSILDPGASPLRDRDIQEVINYRSVMDYLDSIAQKTKILNLESGISHTPLTPAILEEIHRLTLNQLLPTHELGQLRTVKVVIRNTTTGEITYRPPNPLEVPLLLEEFFTWLNSQEAKDTHPLLLAGVLHYELVRIHPFTDGNGRAVRAFALLLLYLHGYELKKFFSLDEYYDTDPGGYYDALASVAITGELTSWLEYFVLGISLEFNRIKTQVQKLSLDLHLKTSHGGKQISLTDRQIKLVEYLEKYVSLGMKEARDLLKEVSEDTILRDLRDLVEKNLLTRKGNTKGAKYYLKQS